MLFVLVTLSACDEPAARGRVITASYADAPVTPLLELMQVALQAEAASYSKGRLECEIDWTSQALRACGSKHGVAREACVATVFPRCMLVDGEDYAGLCLDGYLSVVHATPTPVFAGAP